MRKFSTVRTIATPLDRANVDTDQIVPKQFLKLVQRSGFGKYLFYNWRFLADGRPDPDFVLNDPKYASSRILVAGDNFGCGSSREHAVWALADFGFDVVISPSFADIFHDNCFKNGVLPVSLPAETVQKLQKTSEPVEVSLEGQTVSIPGETIPFEIDPHKRRILLEGLDDIALTLRYEADIGSFEEGSKTPSVL